MNIVFIPDWPNNPYQKSLAAGIEHCGNEVVFGVSYEKFSIFRSVLKARKPKVLHIHWPDPYMFPFYRQQFKNIQIFFISMNFLLQVSVLRLFGIKIIWTVHNLIKHDSQYKHWELFLYRCLSKLANSLIVHSRYAKQQVAAVYSVKNTKKIAVVPHAHYIDDYDNSIVPLNAREKLGYTADDRIILFLGAVRPYKGIEDLIVAFQQLNDPRGRLIVVGECLEPSFAQKLEALQGANPHITLHLERIADEDIQVYMNAADYVALPFRSIFTSGSVMLALSFAKPVIVPAIGCIPELLERTDNILYDPEKDGTLSKALQIAIDTNSAETGKKNYQLIKDLSWNAVGRMTVDVYLST